MVKIDKVIFGEIAIGGKTYYSDVSIDANGRVELLAKTHVVDMNVVAPLLKGRLDCLVVGTGMEGSVGVAPEVEEILENKGIKLFSDNTQDAVDIFNGMVADRKKVAGIFHVTG